MAVRRLSVADMTGRKGSSFVGGYGAGDSVMDSIQTVTIGAGGAASITFSSIPQTYQHLQLRCVLRNNSASTNTLDAYLRFNGDNGTNYASHAVAGTGASAFTTATTSTANPTAMMVSSGGQLANSFGVNIVDILDYCTTGKNRVSRIMGGADMNGGSGYAVIYSTLWLNTAPVTSVTLATIGGSSFVQFSTAALYGIKG